MTKTLSHSPHPEDSDNIVLHFGTAPHEIDARTLVESFGAMEVALIGIAKHGHPAMTVRIKVRAFQRGSFEVPIEIRQCLMGGALALSSVDWATAKESVKIFIELIKLSLGLKGKKPKAIRADGKNVEIVKNDNSSIYVDQRTYNIHIKDVAVTEALARTFQALEADKEIKAFKVLDKKRKELLQVPRRHFRHLTTQASEIRETEQKVKERTTLPIFKAVFGAGYKWEFYYRGIKIPATIVDASFMERVNKGERFGRGDTLDVELEILKKFDNGVQAFVNKAYKILVVHRIQRRPEQMELPEAP